MNDYAFGEMHLRVYLRASLNYQPTNFFETKNFQYAFLCAQICRKFFVKIFNGTKRSKTLQNFSRLQSFARFCKSFKFFSLQDFAKVSKFCNICKLSQNYAKSCKVLQKVCNSLRKFASFCNSLHKFARVCNSLHKFATLCICFAKPLPTLFKRAIQRPKIVISRTAPFECQKYVFSHNQIGSFFHLYDL